MVDYSIRKRFLLFLFGCIGFRLLLVYLAKTTNEANLRLMSYAAIIISFGFMFLYFSGMRKTGPEVFGDKIWWNDLRPIHGLLYFLFAYSVFTRNFEGAWKFLAVDVTIGLVSFLYYHIKSGNFYKLL